MNDNKPITLNEKELLEYYNLHGTAGKALLRFKFLKTWLLHKSAYSSIYPGWAIRMQKARGVKIGKNCHINPYVLIDLMYPQLMMMEQGYLQFITLMIL